MTTAVIIQARVGSTRLPGKVLEKIGTRTIIEEVIDRCRRIPGADVVVCAIPDLARDDELVGPSTRAGAVIVRGSEQDVLSRYVKAACTVEAKVMVRITVDCPLIESASEAFIELGRSVPENLIKSHEPSTPGRARDQ
jgi:spore coat polysaccharide biosynthesis protein SpsF